MDENDQDDTTLAVILASFYAGSVLKTSGTFDIKGCVKAVLGNQQLVDQFRACVCAKNSETECVSVGRIGSVDGCKECTEFKATIDTLQTEIDKQNLILKMGNPEDQANVKRARKLYSKSVKSVCTARLGSAMGLTLSQIEAMRYTDMYIQHSPLLNSLESGGKEWDKETSKRYTTFQQKMLESLLQCARVCSERLSNGCSMEGVQAVWMEETYQMLTMMQARIHDVQYVAYVDKRRGLQQDGYDYAGEQQRTMDMVRKMLGSMLFDAWRMHEEQSIIRGWEMVGTRDNGYVPVTLRIEATVRGMAEQIGASIMQQIITTKGAIPYSAIGMIGNRRDIIINGNTSQEMDIKQLDQDVWPNVDVKTRVGILRGCLTK